MKEIIVVIGKNFGDEGKGQTVNDLCRTGNALVVRHNGGAQAGHTVEEGDFRFVFHQLGSGSYRGCPTFWARSFLPDLLKLGEEMEALAAFSPITHVHASPDCACTTVYDVLLNSLTETLRGSQKHGSCGMGIFEAVLRGRKEPFRLTLGELMDRDAPYLLQRLHRIREQYAKPRLENLRRQFPEQFGRKEIIGWADLICDDQVLFNATGIMWDNLRKYVIPNNFSRLAAQYDRIIFESAQGLMLDWENEEYSPHLTASHTGLKNVAALLQELPRPYSLDVIYVTRAYVTRHGAGRLDHECPGAEINPQIRDATNVPNPWQDALRYARHPRGEDSFAISAGTWRGWTLPGMSCRLRQRRMLRAISHRFRRKRMLPGMSCRLRQRRMLLLISTKARGRSYQPIRRTVPDIRPSARCFGLPILMKPGEW